MSFSKSSSMNQGTKKKKVTFGSPCSSKDISIELYGKSLYDVICTNFEIAGRLSSIARVIYCGDHDTTFYSNKLNNSFESIMDEVNSTEKEEILTGFFMKYPKYFVHVLEGAENLINKHFEILFNKNRKKSLVNRMKILFFDFNVGERLCSGWISYSNIPAKLLDPIDEDVDISTTVHFLKNSVEKLLRLIRAYTDSGDEDRDVRRVDSSATIISVASLYHDTIVLSMPENEVLEHFLNSPLIEEAEKEFDTMNNFLWHTRATEEQVWPVTYDYMPSSSILRPPFTFEDVQFLNKLEDE